MEKLAAALLSARCHCSLWGWCTVAVCLYLILAGCCPAWCLVWKELAMVVGVVLMFATDIEHHWEIAAMCTRVPGGAWAGGSGACRVVHGALGAQDHMRDKAVIRASVSFSLLFS